MFFFFTSVSNFDLTGQRYGQGSIDVHPLILDEQSNFRRIFDILQFLVDAERKCSICGEFEKLLIYRSESESENLNFP